MEQLAATQPHHRTVEPTAIPAWRNLPRRAWLVVSGAGAVVLGLLPHVLHHAGPLAGAALFAGAGGSLLFGALGFIVAIPLLLRLRRRSGGWRAPLAALALFAAAFSISTFVIGPQISGGDEGSATPAPAPSTGTPADQGSSHASHH